MSAPVERAQRTVDARLTAEATLFTSRLRDQIVWRPGRFPDGFYTAPVNIGRTRTTGWELSGRARLPLAGSLLADVGALWAHSAARDRTDSTSTAFGQPLIYVRRPGHSTPHSMALPRVGGRPPTSAPP